jgi:hypothetical protein
VCGSKLRITKVISEVTGIPLTLGLSMPYPNSNPPPSMEELMKCFNSSGSLNGRNIYRNKIPISYLRAPTRLLARIVMQNLYPISRNSDVTLDRARLIFAIINRVPFCMCKHMLMTMIELQSDNNIALPFGGLITKILKKLPLIPPSEPVEIPEGYFRKGTVMKSNAQLQQF